MLFRSLHPRYQANPTLHQITSNLSFFSNLSEKFAFYNVRAYFSLPEGLSFLFGEGSWHKDAPDKNGLELEAILLLIWGCQIEEKPSAWVKCQAHTRTTLYWKMLRDYERNAYQREFWGCFLVGKTNFPRRRNSLRREGWMQLSHHIRSHQIATMKGTHWLVCLIGTTLIQHPCGPQIHNCRQEHVLIDPSVQTVQH